MSVPGTLRGHAADTLRIYAESYLEELKGSLDAIDRVSLRRFADVLLEARRNDRQVFIIGNGGSAATASHLACDLGKGTIDRRDPSFRRFRAISLSDNTALISAIANDLSYDQIFTEQLRAQLNSRDVVVAISASGNSPNLITALEYARESGATTVGLLGFGGGRARDLVDVAVVVESRNYGVAEDFHLIVQHVVTQYLRRAIAAAARPVLFLDRDGVINVRPAPHQYITRWEDFRVIDGAALALRTLAQIGYSLVVLTNQQGVGKGLLTAGQLADIHARMVGALAAQGVTIDGVFSCPHLQSDGCFCRKPRPGLVYRALNEIDYLVDLDASYMVGDSDADLRAGQAAGLRTVFVGDGAPSMMPTVKVRDLSELAGLLASEHRLLV